MRRSLEYGIAVLTAAALITGVAGCGNKPAAGGSTQQTASANADSGNSNGNANSNGNGNSNNPNGNRGGSPRGGGMFNSQALLDLLKIDQQTLQNDLRNDKTLVDIGKEKGITEDKIFGVLVQERIDAAKKQGKTDDEINQSKAQWTDQAKKQAENKMNFNRTGNNSNGNGNGSSNGNGNGNRKGNWNSSGNGNANNGNTQSNGQNNSQGSPQQ
jgi:hypothetical protein